jgi:hypothetical protein
MVTGIVLSGLGAMSGGLFGFAYYVQNMCTSSEPNGCDGRSTLMVATGVGALVGLGVGVPLIFVGAPSVPNEEAAQRVVLSPWASRNSGGLSLSGNF